VRSRREKRIMEGNLGGSREKREGKHKERKTQKINYNTSDKTRAFARLYPGL